MDNLHGGISAELANGVENPKESKAAGFERFCSLEDGFEVFPRALFTEKHDADGKCDFSVDDILCEELFGEILDDKGVVVGRAKKRGDPLEGVEKAEEICVGVASADFVFREVGAVTRGKGGNDCGANAAFEVEMQFGLGKRKNTFRECALEHTSRLSGEVEAGRRSSRR